MPRQDPKSDNALWGVVSKAFSLSEFLYLSTQMERGPRGHTEIQN